MIDAHVHLWGRDTANHPWRAALPEDHRLRREAGCEALLEALPRPVEGIVHIEVNPADSLAETRWLAEAAALLPFPVALVAHVPMAAPDAPERLSAQAAQPGVVGIRDIAAWHPDPARRQVADPHRLESDAFRRSARIAAGLGLGFDLMITSFQAEAAARLAREVPDLRLVLNHCGGPPDSGAEGRALWRDGLERLAERPNVSVKLSDPLAFRPGGSRGWLLDVLTACLDIFGPSRAAFGSNWPIAGLPPAKWAGVVGEAIADLNPAAQARVWSGTARGLYFDGPRPPLPGGGGTEATA